MSTGGRGRRWIAPFIKQGWLGVGKKVSVLWVGLRCTCLGMPFLHPFREGPVRGKSMWVRDKWPLDLEARNAVLWCEDKCLSGVCAWMEVCMHVRASVQKGALRNEPEESQVYVIEEHS